MRILGIETSCDETAVAVVDKGTLVRSNVIATSQQSFASLSGVVPEEAARRQVEYMMPVCATALSQAGTDWKCIDAIAVTAGPGLLGSLLVGTVTARLLSSIHQKPLVAVHHTLGHLDSVWLDRDPTEVHFPILTLSASGGHTDLWLRTSHTCNIVLGSTRDDAAGEAFDKGASLLHLPYPGGPSIARAALQGKPLTYRFPLPLHTDQSLDMSFSGLKTALRQLLSTKQIDPLRTPPSTIADVAASYQHAICQALLHRMLQAAQRHSSIREIHLVGGVSANQYLRSLITEGLPQYIVRWPVLPAYCTDNAAMIAAAGYWMIQEGRTPPPHWQTNATLPFTSTLPEKQVK